MIIDCPSCASAYHIARAQLGDTGRKLRCATCRHVWTATPDPSEVQATPHEIVAEAVSERSQPASYEELYGETRRPEVAREECPQRGAWGRIRPMLGFAVCVVAMSAGMGAIAWRTQVARLVPQTGRLYAAIGLPVNLRGLDLRNVGSTLIGDGAQKILAVEGEIVNVAGDGANVPELRLVVRDANSRNLYTWTAAPPKTKLAKGEIAAFRARLASPPDGAKDVIVRFEPATARTKEARK